MAKYFIFILIAFLGFALADTDDSINFEFPSKVMDCYFIEENLVSNAIDTIKCDSAQELYRSFIESDIKFRCKGLRLRNMCGEDVISLKMVFEINKLTPFEIHLERDMCVGGIVKSGAQIRVVGLSLSRIYCWAENSQKFEKKITATYWRNVK